MIKELRLEVETPALAIVMPLIVRGLKDRDERPVGAGMTRASCIEFKRGGYESDRRHNAAVQTFFGQPHRTSQEDKAAGPGDCGQHVQACAGRDRDPAIPSNVRVLSTAVQLVQRQAPNIATQHLRLIPLVEKSTHNISDPEAGRAGGMPIGRLHGTLLASNQG